MVFYSFDCCDDLGNTRHCFLYFICSITHTGIDDLMATPSVNIFSVTMSNVYDLLPCNVITLIITGSLSADFC